jgi:hypothetical protein
VNISLLIVLYMTNSIETLRENTVKKLEANYTHGYINLEKFEKLLEMAINTSLVEDLTRINSELKDVKVKPENTNNEQKNRGDIRLEETFIGFMSGIKRRGKWTPARKNRIYVLMGGVEVKPSR